MSNFHRDSQPNDLEPEFQIDQQILQKIKEYTVKFTNLSPELQTEAIAKLYLILKGEEVSRQKTEALEAFSINLKHLHRLHTTNYETFADLLADYLETGCEILGLENGIISHIVEQSYIILSAKSDWKSLTPGLELDLTETYCEEVVKEKKTITHVNAKRLGYQNLEIKSYIGTPILVKGETYGTLSFFSTKAINNNFEAKEREIVELMSQSIGRYLVAAQGEKQRQEVEEELRKQNWRSQLFAELAFKIRQSLKLEKILQTTVIEIQKFLQADRVLIFQLNDKEFGGKTVQESVVSGWPAILGQNIVDLCFHKDYEEKYRQGRVSAIADVEKANIQKCHLEFLQQFGIKANLVVPILQKEKLWGLLIAHQCSSPRQWSNLEVELLKQLADQIGIAIGQGKLVEALQESEKRFRTMANSVPVLIWMSGSDKQCTFFNQSWLNFTGRTLAEEIGNGWTQRLHPEDLHYFWNTYNNAFDRLESFQMEYRLQRSDGEYRWILDTGVPRFTQSGEFIGYISTGTDITERKLAAEKLQREYKRSQLLAQVTHKIRQSLQLTEILATAVTEVKKLLQVDRVLIVKLTNDSKIVVEQAECFDCPTMLGEETSEFLLQADYLHEYRLGRIIAISDLKVAIATLSNIELNEELGVKASLVAPIFVQEELWGVFILHQCHIQRVWQEFDIDLSKQLADQIGIAMTQSQLLEHLEKLVIQRTEALTTTNKQLQQEINDRQQAQEDLRRSEEQLRLITDTLPVLIAYIDFQQRYRFINRTYEQWCRKPISEIQGKQVEEIVGKEIYQQIKEYIEMALSGKRVTFEIEISHKDGSDRWVETTYIPHTDEQGRVKGLFGLITDLTERKSIERMKDEFISVVSHELRTPLTSIHGSLKLLATGRLGNLSEEGQQMLAIADENTDRLVRLVNDVLDLQRMQSGKVKIEKRICNAADLMRQAIEAMQGTAQQQRITLLNTPAYIQVWADPDYIVQVLINLLSNAIKFSFPGGSVWMRAEARDNEIIFQVQDYGQGIPKDKLETIFACFQQVDASDSRSKGGTGLGLAICRQIVELHQGKIWAESTLGKGSTFYFTVAS